MKRKYIIARTERVGEVALVRDYGDGTGEVVDTGPEHEIASLRAVLERRRGRG